MECPKCHATMEIVTFAGVTIDRCTACKGLWFDAHELTWLKEKNGSEIIDSAVPDVGSQMDTITDYPCPRCHVAMIRMLTSDDEPVNYEACTACFGIFLDAGEFQRISDTSMSAYLKGLFSRSKKAKQE